MSAYHDLDNAHGAAEQPYQWQEKPVSGGGSKRKWIIISSIVGVVVLAAVGVGLGVGLTRNSSSSSSNRSSTSTSSSSDSSDPSSFTKDANLKQVLYGIAYTPEGSQYPACGNNLTTVIQDIQLLSQLTTRLRLYGADCNQSSLVLDAIEQTKVNMTVFLGNYPAATDAGAAYERQRDEIMTALSSFGTDHVSGVIVGNEFVLDYLGEQDSSATSSDANGALGNAAAAILLPNITDTISQLKSAGYDIQVGNAEAGAYFNNEILEAVDFGMSNVHPWFADVSIDQAAAWTWEFFEETNVEPAAALTNKPTMYIAETGWPTASDNTTSESNGPSMANTTNLQIFLDTYVCQANANGTGYFFFEYFDEVWKAQEFHGVEGHWGLFYSNRTLKEVTIPDCS
ncbi:glycoside hydrolase family 17 protein [Peniophora sp. CONT]|nr:glycoside hydrolase family 17 protein [Peniophora sp. CONT]